MLKMAGQQRKVSTSRKGIPGKDTDRRKANKETAAEEGSGEICPDCNKVCEPNSDSICCDICDCWYHAVECQGLKQSLFQALCDDVDQDLHWFCKGCKRAAGKVMKSVSALSQRQEKLEKDLENVAGRMQKMEDGDLPQKLEENINVKINETIRTGMDEITKQMEAKIAKLMEELKAADMGSHRGRLIDRSRNLMIFKENEVEDEGTRRETDQRTVQSIFDNTLGLEGIAAKSVERIGVYDKERKRPMLVIMETREDRNSVLKRINDIRAADKELIKKIFISADLSQSQRKKEAELRSELRRRREAGESVMIKNKKVVLTERRRTPVGEGQDG